MSEFNEARVLSARKNQLKTVCLFCRCLSTPLLEFINQKGGAHVIIKTFVGIDARVQWKFFVENYSEIEI